ncbi:hypothetical protein K7Z52_23700 [Mycobacterium avium subsp. hominissuis]|nr:hypothetical protein [Mycobacterium avium subsp. hominissuis]MDV3324198.1 hypothetical protein [Mycobacterium avium subsp. hominissuis]
MAARGRSIQVLRGQPRLIPINEPAHDRSCRLVATDLAASHLRDQIPRKRVHIATSQTRRRLRYRRSILGLRVSTIMRIRNVRVRNWRIEVLGNNQVR